MNLVSVFHTRQQIQLSSMKRINTDTHSYHSSDYMAPAALSRSEHKKQVNVALGSREGLCLEMHKEHSQGVNAPQHNISNHRVDLGELDHSHTFPWINTSGQMKWTATPRQVPEVKSMCLILDPVPCCFLLQHVYNVCLIMNQTAYRRRDHKLREPWDSSVEW